MVSFKAVDYSLFCRPVYKDHLDVKSPGNFIACSGTFRQNVTCYNECVIFKICLLFDLLKSHYIIFCLDSIFTNYNELNETVSSKFPFLEDIGGESFEIRQRSDFLAKESADEDSYEEADISDF